MRWSQVRHVSACHKAWPPPAVDRRPSACILLLIPLLTSFSSPANMLSIPSRCSLCSKPLLRNPAPKLQTQTPLIGRTCMQSGLSLHRQTSVFYTCLTCGCLLQIEAVSGFRHQVQSTLSALDANKAAFSVACYQYFTPCSSIRPHDCDVHFFCCKQCCALSVPC